MRYRPLLMATDVAGWTPLHVAVLMGRSEVVKLLLEAGTDATHCNDSGQTAADLCVDSSSAEVFRRFVSHGEHLPSQQDLHKHSSSAVDECEDAHSALAQPRFVPRSPVVKKVSNKKALRHAGLQMFSHDPGRSVAFLVATGALHDRPVRIACFLWEAAADRFQLGEFLGEDYSLSRLLRLEFMNNAKLEGIGRNISSPTRTSGPLNQFLLTDLRRI